MAKNLLEQVMTKSTKKKVTNSEEDENFVEGLPTAINAGYLVKTKTRFVKNNNFSGFSSCFRLGKDASQTRVWKFTYNNNNSTITCESSKYFKFSFNLFIFFNISLMLIFY
jgi:hypothetical protein